jgi:hypothetical protein
MYIKLQSFSDSLPKGAHFLLAKAQSYLQLLVEVLDQQLDKPLVRTFQDLFFILLAFRERHRGLLLSELGAFIMGADKAPAGTKWISNLLRSQHWSAGVDR